MLSHEDRPSRGYENIPSSWAGVMPLSLARPRPQRRHVWVITGPAGCGKTTVAKYLQEKLELPYIEGDEYHPASNVEKMSAGIALTDADRWDWLDTLRHQASVELYESNAPGVVLTCSALKSKYRDVIRMIGKSHSDVIVRFIYLRGNEEILQQRVKQRTGHYMKEDMVHSQFRSLEEPNTLTEPDVLVVSASDTEFIVKSNALSAVLDAMARDKAQK